MYCRLIKRFCLSVPLILSLAFYVSAQSSAIQFFDSTGAKKTAKFGWTGDSATGNFFIETSSAPNQNVKVKNGNLTVDGSVAAGAVTATSVTATTVSGTFTGNGAGLTGVPVTDNSIITAKIADSAVTTAKIKNLAITADKIAICAVTNEKIDSVSWGKVSGKPTEMTPGTGSVSEAAIVDSSITSNKIKNKAVTTEKIDSLAVTAGKIANGAVTDAKISSISWGKVDSASIMADSLARKVVKDSLAAVRTSLHIKGSGWIGQTIESTNGSGTLVLKSYSETQPLANWQLQPQITGALDFIGINGRPFKIYPDCNTNTLVLNAGNVGIGTTSPSYPLHIQNSGNAYCELEATTASGGAGILLATNSTIRWRIRAPAGSTDLYFDNNSSLPQLKLTSSGDLYVLGAVYATNTSSSSDRRFKSSITPLSLSLEKIKKLQGVTYTWNRAAFPDRGFSEGTQIGLIAQDVEKVIPEIVHTDAEGYKSLSYDKLTAVLIEAVKEQQKTIEALTKRVEELERRVR